MDTMQIPAKPQPSETTKRLIGATHHIINITARCKQGTAGQEVNWRMTAYANHGEYRKALEWAAEYTRLFADTGKNPHSWNLTDRIHYEAITALS